MTDQVTLRVGDWCMVPGSWWTYADPDDQDQFKMFKATIKSFENRAAGPWVVFSVPKEPWIQYMMPSTEFVVYFTKHRRENEEHERTKRIDQEMARFNAELQKTNETIARFNKMSSQERHEDVQQRLADLRARLARRAL